MMLQKLLVARLPREIHDLTEDPRFDYSRKVLGDVNRDLEEQFKSLELVEEPIRPAQMVPLHETPINSAFIAGRMDLFEICNPPVVSPDRFRLLSPLTPDEGLLPHFGEIVVYAPKNGEPELCIVGPNIRHRVYSGRRIAGHNDHIDMYVHNIHVFPEVYPPRFDPEYELPVGTECYVYRFNQQISKGVIKDVPSNLHEYKYQITLNDGTDVESDMKFVSPVANQFKEIRVKIRIAPKTQSLVP